MIRLVCVLIGYIFGLFQTSYIYGRMHGIDIRSQGSGNAGTTNALRVLGKKAGVITFIGDGGKGLFCALFIKVIFSASYPDIVPLLVIYGGLGVVLGHNFPFYLNFKGGKGICATGGMILGFNVPMFIVCIVAFVGSILITNYVSVGSMLLYSLFLIQSIIYGQLGLLGMDQAHLIEMYLVIAFLTGMAVYRHRANLKRLASGTENKTYLIKKKAGK